MTTQAQKRADAVSLGGVPETMLWTLHNRAVEARRPDGILRDPDCVRIYDAIGYDYTRSFGRADTSHPMRSKLFDDALRPWLDAHPEGIVVELAAGLETQQRRCDNGRVRWVCVDVPEALEVRERFLPPTDRCQHLAMSALDLRWLDEIEAMDPSGGVFITAQGLLMYFEEADVRALLAEIFARFEEVEVMFDIIPLWFSRKTMRGFRKTRHYTAPPMPWGARASTLGAQLRDWSARVGEVRVTPYGITRGPGRLMLELCRIVPALRDLPPSIARASSRQGGAR